MAASTYLLNKMIGLFLRGEAWTTVPTVYLCLYLSNPTADDVGTEVSTGGYARVAVAFDADAVAGVTANTLLESFTAAGAAYGLVTHWGIRDALTLGNLLHFGALGTPETINDTNTLEFIAGAIDISHT